MTAKDLACAGASVHARAGETSTPSPVCFDGMAPPVSKAVLVSCIDDSANPMCPNPSLGFQQRTKRASRVREATKSKRKHRAECNLRVNISATRGA